MSRQCRFAALLLASASLMTAAEVVAMDPAPEGRVRFYNIADSGFDTYTRNPRPAEAEWMRKRYFRMQTYSPYFDSRLAWYPQAWAYKDSYAIKPEWPVFSEHPEWVLRDSRGGMLYIDWGCKGGTCPQYAADIGNTAFRQWWIEGARSLMRKGYAGVWVDDVNLDWRISSGAGERVLPIDPRTGREMTLENWRAYFARFMEEVRAALPSAEIAHNSIWYAGTADDPYVRRQIAAADFINLERGATDSGLVGGRGRWGFETFLGFIEDVHRQGRAVVLMDYGTTAIEREYALSTWFLISTGRDLMSSNQPGWSAPGQWWSGYGLDLGRALGRRYVWKDLLRRDFACGAVLLNPPGAPLRSVSPEQRYNRLDGTDATQLTLPGSSAAVLVAPCAGAASEH